MASTPVRAAGLIVYRRVAEQVQYLLMQTSYGQHHWTPPKGHVDPGEDDLETALRETEEEASLNKNVHYTLDKGFRRELKYNVKGKAKVVVYWLAEMHAQFGENNDPVKLSQEHQGFKWLAMPQAGQLAGYADMTQLLQECEHYLKDKEV